MNRKFLLCLLATILVTTVFPAHAQQPGKVPRIVYLTGASPAPMKPRTDAFRTGLRELGYIEGKNIVIEWRYADQKFDRVGLLANELVQLKVDIIVTGGPAATRAVKELTSTTPIVMTQDSDPVGNGFVVSLARPGGNITGLSNLSSDLVGKRLEILKEIVAKLSRVAVIGSSNNPGDKREFRELEHVASAFALKLQYLNVLSAKDLEPAFTAANKAGADAVFMNISGPIGLGNRKEIAKLAVKHRLPVIYTLPDYVEAGGLVNYGVNLPDLDRRAATYVDKILKGAKPADLPVEQAMKFDFVINMNAAKQIGLVIPPNVLVRADRVIR